MIYMSSKKYKPKGNDNASYPSNSCRIYPYTYVKVYTNNNIIYKIKHFDDDGHCVKKKN